MSEPRKICLLGSTGSIGTQTLMIVERWPELFKVVALAAGRNVTLLREQIRQFRPDMVSVLSVNDAEALRSEFPGIRIAVGDEGVAECVATDGVDLVVVGIVGFAGLAPTLQAIRLGKTIALANKESLCVAGSLLKREVEKSQARVIPVDSEHNALFQLLEGRDRAQVQNLVLTASGGPLLRLPNLPLEEVTPEIATKHPNWKMGPKISVDSATLMNKGLELIEAHFLFDFPQSRIEIWIHPQSIVHGALWLVDNSCLAQLSKPDMRSSIGYALKYPDRLDQVVDKLSFADMARLEFLAPDEKRFPALRLARQALESGPSYLVALNAANEIAVQSFLDRQIRFSRIAAVIEETLTQSRPVMISGIEDVIGQDAASRDLANNIVRRVSF